MAYCFSSTIMSRCVKLCIMQTRSIITKRDASKKALNFGVTKSSFGVMEHLFDETKHRNLIIWQLSSSTTVKQEVAHISV